ncbi:MAG: hypothetical protein ABIH03_08755 [Pseudomonadota bacterium]
MATIQATDTIFRVEPLVPVPEFEWGPSDYMSANAVLLTSESLRKVGAYPPQRGYDWSCNLWCYVVVAGVPTAIDLTTSTFSAIYWDPVSLVAKDVDVANGPAAGQLVLSLAAVTETTPGTHRFSITVTETQVYMLCSGWIEILPVKPG